MKINKINIVSAVLQSISISVVVEDKSVVSYKGNLLLAIILSMILTWSLNMTIMLECVVPVSRLVSIPYLLGSDRIFVVVSSIYACLCMRGWL